MSTKCLIAIKENDNEYTSICCHNNGYPRLVIETLRDFYNTDEKVKALIDLGDIVFLGATLNFCDDLYWNSKSLRPVTKTRDFHRWKNIPIHKMKFKSIKDMYKYANKIECQYIYVWENNE